MRFRKLGIWFFVLFTTVVCSIVGYDLTEVAENLNKTSRSFDMFNDDLIETARRKKKKSKFIMPLILGALMIKSIIFPLAFKAMAVMSSVAVILSTMSLIVSSIIGYAKLAFKPAVPAVKVVHINDGWAKEDDVLKGYIPDSTDYDPSSIPLQQVHYTNKLIN